MRKQLKNAARPWGGGDAAIMLGAVAAAAALHPEVRARTKDLALAAIDRLQALIAGAEPRAGQHAEHAIERAH